MNTTLITLGIENYLTEMRNVLHYRNQSKHRCSRHHYQLHSPEIHTIYSIQRRVTVEQIFLSHHFPIAKIHVMFLYIA